MATTKRQDALSVIWNHGSSPGSRQSNSQPIEPPTEYREHTGIGVRDYHVRDAMVIGQFPERVELNYPDSQSIHPDAFRLILQRVLMGTASARFLFVAEHAQIGRKVGAIHCQKGLPDGRWLLLYMAGLELDPTAGVSIALLEHAIGEAGWCGARRIMASIETESPVVPAMRATGFSAFAQERVFAFRTIPLGEPEQRVRVQEQSDVWAIHQLYLQTTPRDVQNAEALTSHEWEIDDEGRTRRAWFISGSVGARAWVRVRTSRSQHVVDLMFLSDAVSALERVLRSTFTELAHMDARPVYVRVRSYQQEAATILESMGLQPQFDQYLMVRYTTAPASQPVRLAEAYERSRAAGTNARRAPSYCVGDIHE